MQSEWLQRTELLVKKEGIERLQSSNILIVGLGGVGSFAAEFLAFGNWEFNHCRWRYCGYH